MAITSRDLKQKPDGRPQRLGVVLAVDARVRPFNFDGSRYRTVKKRPTAKGPARLFSSNLRDIAEAKKRTAGARERAVVAAVKALAARTAAPLKVTPVKTAKKARKR